MTLALANGNGAAHRLSADSHPLPHSVEAENAVAAWVFGSDDGPAALAEALQVVGGREGFFTPQVRRLIDLLGGWAADGTIQPGQRFDYVVCGGEAAFAEVGGAAWLGDILGRIPDHDRAADYLKIVRRHHDARRLIQRCHDAMSCAFAGNLESARERIEHDDAPDSDRPRIMKAGALIEKHPAQPDPIIDGLLRVGESMNLIAAPKMSKSFIVADAGLSVATGRDWLGFSTRPGRVLLVDNELFPATIAYRLRQVANAKGLRSEEWIESIDVLSLRGRLVDLFGLGSYLRANAGYALVILDSWYRLAPDGSIENDNSHAARLYNRLDAYAARTGGAFIAVHHSSRGNQSHKSVTDTGAGAGTQSRAVDCHAVLREHESPDALVLSVAVRSFPPVDDRAYRRVWPLLEAAPDLDPYQLKRPTPTRQRVTEGGTTELADRLAFLAACLTPTPAGRTEIQRRARGRWSMLAVNDHLEAGVEAGTVLRTIGDRGKHLFAAVPGGA